MNFLLAASEFEYLLLPGGESWTFLYLAVWLPGPIPARFLLPPLTLSSLEGI